MNIAENILRAKADYDAVYTAGKKSEYDAFWDAYQKNGTRRYYIQGFAYLWADGCYNPKYPIDTTGSSGPSMFSNTNVTDTLVDIIIPADVQQSDRVFVGATRMVTIRKLVVSEKTTFSAWFEGCDALVNITFEGVIANSINFRWSPLSRASITNIIEHLSSSVTDQTITFKKSAKEAAFTDDEWAELIASKPNWTFALL